MVKRTLLLNGMVVIHILYLFEVVFVKGVYTVSTVVYYNSIIGALRSSDSGCHFGAVYVGHVVYADDILLLSALLINMQKCLIFAMPMVRLYILFNPSKSCLFKLGKGHQEVLPNLRLKDTEILWLDSRLKYLGVLGNRHKFEH